MGKRRNLKNDKHNAKRIAKGFYELDGRKIAKGGQSSTMKVEHYDGNGNVTHTDIIARRPNGTFLPWSRKPTVFHYQAKYKPKSD